MQQNYYNNKQRIHVVISQDLLDVYPMCCIDRLKSQSTAEIIKLCRLGPGDPATTKNLAEQLCPDLPSGSRIADFGCGVGASALVLAQSLPKARVFALDSHAPFVARLENA